MRVSSIFFVILPIIGFILGIISSSFVVPTKTITTINECEGLETYTTLEKTITSTVTLTITEVFHESNKGINISCIIFRTDKNVYNISERVVLILENDCDHVLMLPNSAPWLIMSFDSKVVYSPVALQVITDVRPSSELKWVWNQKDGKGEQVLAGKYYVKLITINAGILTTEFEILEP